MGLNTIQLRNSAHALGGFLFIIFNSFTFDFFEWLNLASYLLFLLFHLMEILLLVKNFPLVDRLVKSNMLLCGEICGQRTSYFLWHSGP